MGPNKGAKLRAVDDLKRSQTNRAAAIRIPVNLLKWIHISAATGTFQESGAKRNLAMAKADHKDAYKQLPVKNDHRLPAAVTLQDPESGVLRGFGHQTQLFGATAAVSRNNAVSRVMATVSV